MPQTFGGKKSCVTPCVKTITKYVSTNELRFTGFQDELPFMMKVNEVDADSMYHVISSIMNYPSCLRETAALWVKRMLPRSEDE